MNDDLNALSNIGPRIILMIIIITTVTWFMNRNRAAASKPIQASQDGAVILRYGMLSRGFSIFGLLVGVCIWLCLPFADAENVVPIFWLGALFTFLGGIMVAMTFWYTVRYDDHGFTVRYGYSPSRKVAWNEVVELKFSEVSKNYEVTTTQTKSKVVVSSFLQGYKEFEMRCQLAVGIHTLPLERFWRIINSINVPATTNPKHRATRLADSLADLSHKEEYAFVHHFFTVMNALTNDAELVQLVLATQPGTTYNHPNELAQHLKANIIACGQSVYSDVSMSSEKLQQYIHSCDDWFNYDVLEALPDFGYDI